MSVCFSAVNGNKQTNHVTSYTESVAGNQTAPTDGPLRSGVGVEVSCRQNMDSVIIREDLVTQTSP